MVCVGCLLVHVRWTLWKKQMSLALAENDAHFIGTVSSTLYIQCTFRSVSASQMIVRILLLRIKLLLYCTCVIIVTYQAIIVLHVCCYYCYVSSYYCTARVLLSSSSSSCWVFTIVYLIHTMFLECMVLQLFCIYNLCYM